MPRLANRVSSIPESGIHKYDGIPGAIYLTVGESDYPVPKEAIVGFRIDLKNGKYLNAKGLSSFRKMIKWRESDTAYQSGQFLKDYSSETEIMPTCGVQQGIDLAFRALLNPGDVIAIPFPAYVTYEPSAILANARIHRIKLSPLNGYKLTAEDVEKAGKSGAKVLVLNYPHNPTGATMGKHELAEIADVALSNDMTIISDEIYSDIYYSGKHYSISWFKGCRENTLVLNGFSKSYAMGGYRIGYACGPENVISGMEKLQAYSAMSAPRISQEVAVNAFCHSSNHVRTMVADYGKRVDHVTKRLNEIGLPTRKPEGAIYEWVDISGTSLTSEEFVRRLVKDHKVVTVPGTAFGREGEGFIRISIAVSPELMDKGLNEIEKFVKEVSK